MSAGWEEPVSPLAFSFPSLKFMPVNLNIAASLVAPSLLRVFYWIPACIGKIYWKFQFNWPNNPPLRAWWVEGGRNRFPCWVSHVGEIETCKCEYCSLPNCTIPATSILVNSCMYSGTRQWTSSPISPFQGSKTIKKIYLPKNTVKVSISTTGTVYHLLRLHHL